MSTPTIIYTITDEAPALATHSFLPIIKSYLASSGVNVETRDISLAGRVLALFPDYLSADQVVSDDLAELGELVKTPEANVIKLPNISASIPQLQATIAELQAKGYALPEYPEEPENDTQRDIQARYNKAKGSAVNPVLREGNSDRRAPKAVKAFAQKNPHRMGAWTNDSRSHVASMNSGDFFGSELSVTLPAADSVSIIHVDAQGIENVLKADLELQAGEVIDSSFMSVSKLRSFLDEQIADAKAQDVLFSVHLKATMMKVSDPIIFGHVVKAYYAAALNKHAAALEQIGFDPNNGIGDLYRKLSEFPADQQAAIKADVEAVYAEQPALYMVNSDKGITNLHVPSDVIIDASMPAMLRTSGRGWGPDGLPKDTKAVIPDRSYSSLYQEVVDFCKEHGAFDVTTMGSVSNVGLMAQKAEEYGSHNKTFELAAAGTVKVVNAAGSTLMSHEVEAGDIWRMCQTKDAPITDWVHLALRRARATGVPAVFWLDSNRAHDAQLITKVNAVLAGLSTDDVELHILAPREATRFTLDRVRAGKDTISVTGNVLRDYLTDLFPILELGTSAKMLSIVPLMNGGGLFETGAGGSAPKHVQQFEEENHLRWDSLGEFLALAVSLDHVSEHYGNPRAKILGETLDNATTKYLLNRKEPSRKVNERDNRGSHFYLAMYWAQELAAQSDDADLANRFVGIAQSLTANEATIVRELNAVQGMEMNIGGYYFPDAELAAKAMRPSATFNRLLSEI